MTKNVHIEIFVQLVMTFVDLGFDLIAERQSRAHAAGHESATCDLKACCIVQLIEGRVSAALPQASNSLTNR